MTDKKGPLSYKKGKGGPYGTQCERQKPHITYLQHN